MKIKFISILAAVVLLVGVGVLSVHAQTSTSNIGSTYTTTSVGNSSGSTSSNTTGMVSASGTSASPGLPNTGTGGDAAKNLSVLTSSVVLAIAGAGYLMMRRMAVR